MPFNNYGKFDGLPSSECSGGYQPDCWAGADGRLWFTTSKGAAWINPRQLPFNALTPAVQIEEFSVDKPIMFGPGAGLQSRREPTQSCAAPLRISPGRNYFESKFTALSFVSTDKVRFKWRLRGTDREWVDGGTDRSASYSYLPPGDYDFSSRRATMTAFGTKRVPA